MSTKGKIFAESNNIYQDQAKLLFNYYQQAAEKIVSEEERLEGEMEKLRKQKAEIEKKISGLWVWFLSIILFFMYFIKKKKMENEISKLNVEIERLEKEHRKIFRNYQVSKMGVAYVPIADQVKYEDKSFIVDYTGKIDQSEIVLQMSRRNDLMIETINKLENLAIEAPIVESSKESETISTEDYSTSIQEINQNDYLGGLERSLRTIAFCMNDLETTSVSLPLVSVNNSYLNFLDEYATSEVPQDATIIPVFDKDKFTDSISKFQELNKLKDSLSTENKHFEDVLRSLMGTIANSVQAVSALKIASVDKVVFESNKLLYHILKSPYNHYSPVLEHEEIERIRNEKFDYNDDIQNYKPFNLRQSSRMKFNLATGMWNSEDGNVSSMPFGVHQLYEEIVAPVVQNLMEENRLERLKVYNHIKDQKIEYLNRWHQDTDAFYRANRAESSDIINLMQESLREYVAAYNTLIALKKTEDAMQKSNEQLDSTVVSTVDNTAETLTAFELQSKEFQNTQTAFEDYMSRLKEDIEEKAERFSHIDYYDAKLRDSYSNEVAMAANEVQDLDNRRKSLATVNPLLAKDSVLPPEPNVEDITFEHIALNLPSMAKSALDELDSREDYEKTVNETKENANQAEDADAPAADTYQAAIETDNVDNNNTSQTGR